MLYYWFVETPLGQLTLWQEGGALVRACWDSPCPAQGQQQYTPVLELAQQQLDAYFAGDGTALEDVPISPTGSAFQQQVWQALRRIPAGQVRSYGQIAHLLGRPKASRAVGRACHTNPLPLFIPCHRVVAASGQLTGYAYGLERKSALLTLEGWQSLTQNVVKSSANRDTLP